MLSAYGKNGGSATSGGVFDSGVKSAGKCQDCHMRDVTGKAAGIRTTVTPHRHASSRPDRRQRLDDRHPCQRPTRTRLCSTTPTTTRSCPAQKYPGAKIDVGGLQQHGGRLDAAKQRALQQLKMAGTVTQVAANADSWTLRVNNNTGHKLISGFPEGRRMFLNVKYFDAAGAEMPAFEINPYAPLVTSKDAQGNDVVGIWWRSDQDQG